MRYILALASLLLIAGCWNSRPFASPYDAPIPVESGPPVDLTNIKKVVNIAYIPANRLDNPRAMSALIESTANQVALTRGLTVVERIKVEGETSWDMRGVPVVAAAAKLGADIALVYEVTRFAAEDRRFFGEERYVVNADGTVYYDSRPLYLQRVITVSLTAKVVDLRSGTTIWTGRAIGGRTGDEQRILTDLATDLANHAFGG